MATFFSRNQILSFIVFLASTGYMHKLGVDAARLWGSRPWFQEKSQLVVLGGESAQNIMQQELSIRLLEGEREDFKNRISSIDRKHIVARRPEHQSQTARQEIARLMEKVQSKDAEISAAKGELQDLLIDFYGEDTYWKVRAKTEPKRFGGRDLHAKDFESQKIIIINPNVKSEDVRRINRFGKDVKPTTLFV